MNYARSWSLPWRQASASGVETMCLRHWLATVKMRIDYYEPIVGPRFQASIPRWSTGGQDGGGGARLHQDDLLATYALTTLRVMQPMGARQREHPTVSWARRSRDMTYDPGSFGCRLYWRPSMLQQRSAWRRAVAMTSNPGDQPSHDGADIDDLLESLTVDSGPSAPGGGLSDALASPRTRQILLAVGGVALLGVLLSVVLSWMAFSRSGDTVDAASGDATDAADADTADVALASSDEASRIAAVLDGLGFTDVTVEDRDGTVHLIGTVATEADRSASVGAAQALVGDRSLDVTALTVEEGGVTEAVTAVDAAARAEALDRELNRIVAATPIIFDVGQYQLTELHKRVLNNVAGAFAAYPGVETKVIGFTDRLGADDANRELSGRRAASVKAYLVEQGVDPNLLVTEERGASGSTGAEVLASLERRVEFEVLVSATAPLAQADETLRIAIVAPSARNDLAFTQSMVDAVERIAGERGNVEVAITDNTFVPDEATAAISGYADQGYDLVIAHGSQFGASLADVARDHPDVAFAWGTASDNFGVPNIYAYDAAAGEGGYVLGALAATLSQSGVVGVIGPIEVGDGAQYINGFNQGARTERPDVNVLTQYTNSFSDLTLAAEVANSHIDGGADVLTGSAQMVVGAVSVAAEKGVAWFGNQSNQAELAPALVVASQVYHWEVILRQIITDIDGAVPSGRTYTANLANGGLVIEYNPSYTIDPAVQARGEAISLEIISGTVVPVG
ncbi:MAG: BMP family ABC transporter substrate-binding protein [Acidimicrobiales bacterium]